MRFITALLIVALFVGTAFGAAVYVIGPNQRGEGALAPGGGSFTIDYYGEGFGFAQPITAMSMEASITSSLGGPAVVPGPISYSKVFHYATTPDTNATFYPYVAHIDPALWEGLTLIICPPSGLITSTIVDGATVDTRKLLISITYDYTAAAAPATCTVGLTDPLDPWSLSFLMTGSNTRLPFTLVPGSFTVAPEPGTMCVLGIGLLGLLGYGRRRIRG